MARQTHEIRDGIITAMVVGAFLFLDLLTPSAFESHSEWLLVIMLGICIGQLNLIATWAALAPGNVVVRLPWSLLLAVFMWYALVVGNRIESSYYGLGEAVQLGLILLFGVLVAIVPLWIAGRVFGWRLISWIGQESQEVDTAGSKQFHLWHLLLGMFLLSLVMAPARLVLPEGENFTLRLDDELYVLLAGVALYNLVVTVPCIWGAFLPPSTLPGLIIGWFFYNALLTAFEYGFFVMFLGGPGDNEVPFYMYLMNIVQCATVFGTLLIFRACGFRLLRMSPRKKHGS